MIRGTLRDTASHSRCRLRPVGEALAWTPAISWSFGRFRIDGEGFRVFVERRTPVVLLELPLIALLQLLVLRDELDKAVRNGSVGLSVETSSHSFTVNHLLTLVEMLPRRRLL